MSNQKNTSSPSSSRSTSGSTEGGSETSAMTTPNRGGAMQSGGFDGDSIFDQFTSFMKSNWRPLLMEMVAAGVTAYMTHASPSSKSSKAPN